MFFDEANCRAVRLLQDASHFLEASLEKLLALEKEALAEVNSTISNKNESNFSENGSSCNEISKESSDGSVNINIKPAPLSAITKNNESSCLCDKEREHRSPCKLKKINLSSDFVNTLTITPENSSKRKEAPSESDKKSKKKKSDHIKLLLNDEAPHQFNFNNKLLTSKNDDQILQQVSESSINEPIEVKPKINSDGSLQCNESNNSTNDSGNACQTHKDPSTSKNLAILDKFYKVQIKFKESLSYEQVDELAKSVGLDDVFDILLVKKKAELTFLSEDSVKKALNLPKSARKKLKATEIVPVENNTEL